MQPPDDIFFASLVLFDFVEIMVFLNLYNIVFIVRPSENRHQLLISFSESCSNMYTIGKYFDKKLIRFILFIGSGKEYC